MEVGSGSLGEPLGTRTFYITELFEWTRAAEMVTVPKYVKDKKNSLRPFNLMLLLDARCKKDSSHNGGLSSELTGLHCFGACETVEALLNILSAGMCVCVFACVCTCVWFCVITIPGCYEYKCLIQLYSGS